MSDDSPKPSRRELLAGTFGVAGAIWLVACDDGGGGSDAGGTDAGGDTDAGPPECNTVGWEMSNRHFPGARHSIDVPVSDVEAGVEVSYDITGESDHPHTVVVTADDFARIAAGERVTITSSVDDMHDHDVTLFCSA